MRSQFLLLACAATATTAATLSWAGHEWKVKDAPASGPGPNKWSPDNVFVDEQGRLHMKISYDAAAGKWVCAELQTTTPLGFGTYQWDVVSDLDFDENVVLGFFPYGAADGVDEIDIEYSKWGNRHNRNNADYNVYPAVAGHRNTVTNFHVKLSGTYTTQRMTWTPSRVDFLAMGGHQPVNATQNIMHKWSFAPADSASLIPQHPLSMHANLWLFKGRAPAGGQGTEVIVSAFSYTPL